MSEVAVELHSSYLSHPDGDTAITQLHPQLSQPSVTVTEFEPGSSLPVREARRPCLYRQLAALREQIADHTGGVVTVEVAARALERVVSA